ncbi:Ldh family oxidoreductase [Actinacidiphila sp. bgisy145]|uniref:Ldh family oxidoreductase n=1 Tax=Actinacidiphila sp. bgisy145 TaxID=3413792 RepID=UPI003EB9FD67
MNLLSFADHTLLLELLALPTAGPLECGPGAPAPELWAAGRRYAEAAAALGFHVLHHAAAPPDCLARDDVPVLVRRTAAAQPEFLACQPSLVLALGPADAPHERTVMFNVHLDTVAGVEPVSFDGARFHGRGAIDAKGPAVALLAGLRRALGELPGLARDTRVLIQAVAGEEGGALGTFGTRPLVEAGHHGRLNVFCEPTGGRALTRCTAAMTALLSVHGDDAIDDRPAAGHNATVLLGFLAQHLAAVLDPELAPADGQLCVAGLHTGTLHNRVHGRGQLLLNLSYGAPATARRLERLVREAVDDGLRAFAAVFGRTRRFARTARDAPGIVRLEWLKRGLPVLGGDASPWLGALLERAAIPPWPAEEPGFTCDAIWTSGVAGAHCVVLGPGSLDANRAHAEGEFADLAGLEGFAATVPRLLGAFRTSAPPAPPAACPPPSAPYAPFSSSPSSPSAPSSLSGEDFPMPLPNPPLSGFPAQAQAQAQAPAQTSDGTVRLAYDDLLAFVTDVFVRCGVPASRAATAAEALCYGDLSGMDSHGLANLTRQYLPLFEQRRTDPAAEPEPVTDLGAALRVDAHRALGLWAAAEAMDLAVERAEQFGIGLVSVYGATHFGCAGYHAARAAHRGLVGLVASNCGGQRITRPPGGQVTMLGTNPLAIAAPAGPHHPFVLDMSTTVVPTGRVRAAARAGRQVPEGWLTGDDGLPVTDPAAFDLGRAHLGWLGGTAETGVYKGYGLGLAVEVLAGLVSGSGLGPAPAALNGDGRPSGRDDDIGYLVAAIAPALLRPKEEFAADAGALFGSLLDCPPLDVASPVRYPGWPEGERARTRRATGVPISCRQYRELADVAEKFGLTTPVPLNRTGAGAGAGAGADERAGADECAGADGAAHLDGVR